jgi:pyruvate-ferredoxin/flavodoxin oxidoreductase
VSHPHFVACSVAAYLELYEVIDGIRKKGTFLLNSIWDAKETIERIPNRVKKILAKQEINFYIINATKLAREIGLGNRSNTIMQSAFFKLADIIDYDKAQEFMKKQAYKAYGKKGDHIVKMNYQAIDMGAEGLVKVPVDPSWASLPDDKLGSHDHYKGTEYVEKIAKPMNTACGNQLSVSAFAGYEDGSMEHGSTEYEKRGVGVTVPKWIEENCIQCNQCVFACPHAVIRAFLIDDKEFASAPDGIKTHAIDAKGKGVEGLKYKIQVSPLDCTGCDLCVAACPTKEKSLEMIPLQDSLENKEQESADYLFKKVTYKDSILNKSSVKGVGFSQALFEFHGACPGCGETPYITLVTRLFGESMSIANATGCSSIYGASAPSTPYRKNSDGRGPSWGNSLFEDNAEFGYGMKVATETLRHRIEDIMIRAQSKVPAPLAELFKEWIEAKGDRVKSLHLRNRLEPLLEANKNIAEVKEIIGLKSHLAKRSQWIIGGDGWAYDIGYGGLDHVLASGEDVNVLVLDTEVYSNTGGQSSKASRTGSIAQFTASGKPIQKKDLGYIAMTYENIYVAQINSNASAAQTIKAIEDAEAYSGTSLIIAYSPCIAHGIKGGLGLSGNQAELATKCGYWPIYTYDPRLKLEGKNPVKISGKEPDWALYEEFLNNEVRYTSLKKMNPSHAAELFENNKKDAQRRYRQLKRIAEADYSNELE